MAIGFVLGILTMSVGVEALSFLQSSRGRGTNRSDTHSGGSSSLRDTANMDGTFALGDDTFLFALLILEMVVSNLWINSFFLFGTSSYFDVFTTKSS